MSDERTGKIEGSGISGRNKGPTGINEFLGVPENLFFLVSFPFLFGMRRTKLDRDFLKLCHCG